MTAFLLLRLEAPLMSFGGPSVDFIGPTHSFPGQAQMAGLLGNALGYCHGDTEALGALQARLRLAAALLRPGERVRDYQTVDLGRPHLVDTGWTTRGAVEKRAGASSKDTHIRHRWYLADACLVVALTLCPADASPDLAALAAALDHPARPLFIGRKPCLPATRLLLGTAEAATAEDALRQAAQLVGAQTGGAEMPSEVQAEFDARLGEAGTQDEQARLVDQRDWRNQVHTGERAVWRRALALGAAR